MAKITVWQTNDGEHACFRYQDQLFYGDKADVARELGIPSEDIDVQIDQEAYERERKRVNKPKARQYAKPRWPFDKG